MEYYHTDAENGTDFLKSDIVSFSISLLLSGYFYCNHDMGEVKPVVAGKKEFEYGDNSITKALSGNFGKSSF